MLFKKKIAILGSTGSVGSNALNVISKYPKLFNVNLLVCDKNYKKIIFQVKKFTPKYVFIKNYKIYLLVKKKFKNKKILFFNKFNELEEKLKLSPKFDKVIVGIPSIDGIKYCFAFINYSKELLIANKESLICGGKILLKKAKKRKCKIFSIDSEHYCLDEILKNEKLKNIDCVYLTASGGPFLNYKKKLSKNINIKDVINHPTWSMGKKISVDSATMVNKIFELIEAHILFSIPIDKLKIKIHKESLVHTAVILKNGLVKMIMHDTSMQIPIRNRLFDNNFYKITNNYFKENKNFSLNFSENKLVKYNIIKTGYKILYCGHATWILFNVINDYLVKRFLNKEIFFYEIVSNLNKVFNSKNLKLFKKKKIKNLSDINKMIKLGNKIAYSL